MKIINKLNKYYNTVLASQSPRRKEILSKIGLNFCVTPSNFDESSIKASSYENIEEYTKTLCVRKCEAVFVDLCKLGDCTDKQYFIIAADTLVLLNNGSIVGKPTDIGDAFKMLRQLRNTTHTVVTSVCLMYNNNLHSDAPYATKVFSEKTVVEFGEVSDEEILDYISSSDECLDKAGAYAIQGLSTIFVKGIQGDFYNVMGFPLHKFYNSLKELEDIDGI